MLHADNAMTDGRGRTSHSKGCATCRERRVKCDERRPACLRCEKSHRKCRGYNRPLVIIQSEGKTQMSSKSSSAKYQKTTTAKDPQAPPPMITSLQSSKDSNLGLSHCFGFAADNPMSLEGFREEIIISHLLHKLYKGPSIEASVEASELDGSTLSNVLANGNRHSMAYAAMLSVGQAFFGRVHGISNLVTESKHRYVKVLRQLQEELATCDHISTGSVQWYTSLWGCSFLGMYEMICSSSPTAWIQHICGVAALTEAAGPHAFQAPSTKVIFDINRSFIVVGCIARRKRTFLERDEWQTIPWAKSAEPKSTATCIQDMLCRLPGLMEEVDTINANDRSAKLHSLRARVQTSLVEVDQLGLVWSHKHSQMRCSSQPRESDSPFSSVYYFPTFQSASEVIQLNVIILLLYGVAEKADLALDRECPPDSCVGSCLYHTPEHLDTTPLAASDSELRRQSAQYHAFEICRSIEFMVASSEHDSLGAMTMIFPLRVVARYVEGCHTVSTWLHNQLRRFSRQKGFGISARVLGGIPGGSLPISG